MLSQESIGAWQSPFPIINSRLDYTKNGNMINGVNATLTYNWDNKLRSAAKGSDSISLKYDPSGNRIRRQAGATSRKYIVDIVGDLPVILLELDGSGNVQNKYIYANSQILAQHNTSTIFFYLHDRLGSTRQIINSSAGVVRYYSYAPFGETLESGGWLYNPFMFTGQRYDSEFSQYYLRARQYDPYLGIFTAIDPVSGSFKEPMTLHTYLYCLNDPVNKIDPTGRFFSFAELLISSALEDNLRKMDYKFHMAVFNKCKGQIDAFSLANLQRGAMYDLFIANIEGDLRDMLSQSGVSAIGLFSKNLSSLTRIGVELYGDRGVIMNILENNSWSGLFDYSKDKFKDILLDPDTYF